MKPAKKVALGNREYVLLEDIAEVVTTEAALTKKVKEIKVLKITVKEKTSLMVSITDIVSEIKRCYPEYSIINLGESETLIDYAPQKSADSKILGWLKIMFVAMVLFTGSATAIMSFYTDAQLAKIFEKMYFILFGVESSSPLIIEIPYCIGLAAGIVVFFNHAGGKRIDGDPTPIEVEMSLYESSVTDTMLDALNTQRIREGNLP